MKKIFILAAALLSGALYCSGGDNKAASTNGLVWDKANESLKWFSDTLAQEGTIRFLWEHYYTFNEMTRGKTYFGKYFRYNDTTNLESPDDIIQISELKKLLACIKYNPKGGDLSALKIHFGMIGKKVVLIYQPVQLIPVPKSDYFDQADVKRFFVTDPAGGEIKEITEDDLKKYTASYMNDIRIKHTDDATFTLFVDAPSFKEGDIHRCVIPIQQIVRMYQDNLPKGELPKLTDKVLCSVIANNYYRYTGRRYKSHLVFHFNLNATDPIGNPPGNQKYLNLGADFTQLCPPKCQTVQFTMETVKKKRKFRFWPAH